MRINNGIEDLARVFSSPAATPSASVTSAQTAPAAGAGRDQARLSTLATQIAETASAPDVRLDKVASIQSALRAGTYRVPASDVAKKMVDSMLDSNS